MLNSSKSCRALVRDFSEPLRISVVSSAYWLILISLPLIKIPSISLFVLILSANISTQKQFRIQLRPYTTVKLMLKSFKTV